MMATAAENLLAARAWMQAMVERNPAKMGTMAAGDVQVLEVAEGEVHGGRDFLIWAYEDLFLAYPDCTCEIVNDFAGDDQVMVEVQWRGTETGSFRGQPPTGGTVDIRIGYVFKFTGGLISAITEYYDAATLERQLAGS
jgi:steroid delta-isomerase-like uncharacterized protein